MQDQQVRKELKTLRLDMEKWFKKMEKEMKKSCRR